MEKLSSKKFDNSQIISDQEGQNLFGGINYATKVTSGANTGKKDTWSDTNENGKYDKGDSILIFGLVVPPDPTDVDMPYTLAELQMMEIDVTVLE